MKERSNMLLAILGPACLLAQDAGAALVLAEDVSFPVRQVERRLQPRSHVAALRDPEVQLAIVGAPADQAGLTCPKPADPDSQRRMTPCVPIGRAEAAAEFAALPIPAGSREPRVPIDAYDRNCVPGEAGTFSLRVTYCTAIAAVIRQKLIREISGLRPCDTKRIRRADASDSLRGEKAMRQDHLAAHDSMTSGPSARMAPREEDWATQA